jgi:hypothetical protein
MPGQEILYDKTQNWSRWAGNFLVFNVPKIFERLYFTFVQKSMQAPLWKSAAPVAQTRPIGCEWRGT